MTNVFSAIPLQGSERRCSFCLRTEKECAKLIQGAMLPIKCICDSCAVKLKAQSDKIDQELAEAAADKGDDHA